MKLLQVLVEKNNGASVEGPITLGVAMTTVARLGGYMARPSDPPPGAQVLWKGYLRFDGMVDGFRFGIAMTGGP